MKKTLTLLLCWLVAYALTAVNQPSHANAVTGDANTVILDHFDGTTLGEVHGSASYASGMDGLSQAIDLSANGNYVLYGASVSLEYKGTIEMWVYPNKFPVNLLNVNWNYASSYPPAGHVVHLQLDSTGRVTMGTWGYSVSNGIAGVTSLPLNQWTHIAVSWGDTTKVFVNGKIDKISSTPLRPAIRTQAYYYLPYWGTGPGLVDDLHVSSVQRSYAEIASRVVASPTDQIYAVTAGNLSNVLTAWEKANLKILTVSGTIDARDFKTMRDMPLLETLDLSRTTILSYEGTEGPRNLYDYYPDNTIPRNAFYVSTEKSALTTVIHPANLKAIGRSAYNLCSGLKNVNLPTGLNSIGIYAFYNCRSLASVVIPDGVELVDTNTFRSCIKLTSVTIPPSVRKINQTAFYSCNELSQVNFLSGSNLEEIGIYAFGFCPKLVNFNMPSSVRKVANVAFLGTGVVLNIPTSHPYLATIGGVLYDKALTRLLYCPSSLLGRVDIPFTVTSIAEDAFYNCTGLDSITMPTSLQTIEDWAFENCIGLKTMAIPASVEYIWSYAFYNCSGLKAIYSNTLAPVDLTDADSVFNYIDKNVCKLYVLSGLKAQYQAAAKWKEFANIVEISDAIQVSAGGLAGLLTADQKSTMRRLCLKGTIDARDFRTIRDAMPRLEYLDLTQTTVLAYSGTEGTNENVEYVYTADMTPFRAFFNATGNNVLKTVLLPAGLKIVGRSSFNRCYALSRVDFPSSLTTIERLAFYVCGSLTEVNLPSSLTTLGYGAFMNSNIQNLTLPEGFKSMDEYAFKSCNNLEQVSLPATLERIGFCAFTFNNNLKAFTVASASPLFKAVDGVLFDKTGSILVTYPNKKGNVYTVPEGVVEIDTAAFEGCWVLNRIYLPTTLKRLCHEAFYNCNSLQSIELPAGLTSIENYAFSGCSGLLNLRVGSSTPLDLTNVTEPFAYIDLNKCLLRVPTGSKFNYQLANVWNAFTNMAEDFAKTVSVLPGGLYNALTMGERNSVTHLKVNGSIDARDFKTMREYLPLIAEIDLSGVGIAAYTGSDGTRTNYMTYNANTIPPDAFFFRDRMAPQRWMNRVVFPSSLREVGDAAFVNTALGSLTLPEGLTTLQTWAFYGCRFPSVNIPASVNYIGEFCFGSNTNLQTFTVASTNPYFTVLDGMLYDKAGTTLYCFPNAMSQSAIVPGSTTTIKRGAFDGCNLLEYIQLPGSLTTIETPAFAWTGSMHWYDISSSNPYFTTNNGVLYSKDMKRLIAYPNQLNTYCNVPAGVTEIGPYAFAGDWNLQSISLPNTLNKISANAFFYVENLYQIALPGSVNTIEQEAFSNCFKLRYINAYWTSPPSLTDASNVFNGVDKSSCVLRVPMGCSFNYRFMSQWGDFQNIDELQAMTYHVLVPNGTKACYLAGEMNGWMQQEMQKESSNGYFINLMAHRSDEYKYCSGPEWMYEELDGFNNVISNRNFNGTDTVRQWRNVYQPWMPYSPWSVAVSEFDQYGKIQMLNPLEGWIANGNDNSLFHTTNSGLDWQKVTPFPNDRTAGFPEVSTSMDWEGPSKGWALKTLMTEGDENANGAVVYRTMDAGLNWSRIALPTAFQPVTYQSSDLQGSWQLHQLVFKQSADSQNRYTDWSRIVMDVAADGLLSFSESVMSSGTNTPSGTMHMMVSSGGQLSMDNQSLRGFLGRDKQTGVYIVSEQAGSLQFGFMQKKQAGVSYQPSDLAGTWYMYSLNLDNPSDANNNNSDWMRLVLTIDASGNGTAQRTAQDGSTGSSTFQMQVSSEGIVTITGIDWHGFLSPSKNEMYVTMTDGNNSRYDLCMLQKQDPATTYHQSDLAGAWQMHEYSVTNNAFSLSDHTINAGVLYLRGDGSGTLYTKGSYDGDKGDATVNLNLSSGGILTERGINTLLHGFMDARKNTIQYVRYENGTSVMGLLQKDSTYTGDLGLQVQFSDETKGWASIYNTVSNTIRLYRTTNGGTDWQPTAESPSGFFHFLDANNGWSSSGYFTGTDSTGCTWSILHTTDGGEHWKSQFAYNGTSDDALTLVQFTDANNGWAIGDQGRILKTTDAGEHWTLLTNAGLTPNDGISTMFFLDANTGWIAVDSESSLYILQTLDGGATWTSMNTNLSDGAINSLYFTDALHGWFTGRADEQGFIGILQDGAIRIRPISVKTNWLIYPNPVTTGFTLSSAEPFAQAALYDLNGTCLQHLTVEGNTYVDMSHRKKGVYLLRITTANSKVVRKIVKM